MRQDQLTHTLTARISPALRDELATAAERNDETVGAFVRRAVRAELDDARGRALDPYADLSHDEKEAQLIAAIRAIGDPEATQDLVTDIGDELVDLMDGVAQTLDVLHDETAHQRFERASGYLRQSSEALLRAAFRVRAMRVHRAIADGELERIETHLRQEG